MEEEDERDDSEEVIVPLRRFKDLSSREQKTAKIWEKKVSGIGRRMRNAGSFNYDREGNMVNKINSLLSVNRSMVVDSNSIAFSAQKFIAEIDGDTFWDSIRLAVNKQKFTFRTVIEKLKEPLKDARAVMPTGRDTVFISGDFDSYPVFMSVYIADRDDDETQQEVHDAKVSIIAHPEAVDKLKILINEAFKEAKLASVKWWYQGAHGVASRDIYLPRNSTMILPEYYPDMPDPAQYIADYLAAPESVLLIAGPPGTGKTTLLRHMIQDHQMKAHIIYDENLMQKDTIFQSFLFDEEGDIMIIEDADTILGAREAEGNKMMSRFLNVSDGLIKLPNKKLVFTTNLTDFGKVDHALMRPGRCFGVMQTRALDLAEAQAAAKVAKLPIPIEKRQYTIAELFNQGKRTQIRTMGFGTNH